MAELQILIAAYGKKGIDSIASMPHPEMQGVEYLVSWQYGDDKPEIPRSLAERKDFKIVPTSTRGLSVNRNLTLEMATGEILLISDDDVCYTSDQLRAVIEAFRQRPGIDFICFKYDSKDFPVAHPEKECVLRMPPWWLVSFCMAFRRKAVEDSGIRFNERFGIGAEFTSAEESVFLFDLLQAGFKAMYLPISVVSHPGDTTVMRIGDQPDFIRAKAASFCRIYPLTWPLRMATHSWRFSPELSQKARYLRTWLDGVKAYHRHDDSHIANK